MRGSESLIAEPGAAHLPQALTRRPATGSRWFKRTSSGLGLAACASLCVACLAFKDFKLEEDQDDSSTSTLPCAGAFECVGQQLRACKDGQRENIGHCGTDFCNVELGSCTSCRPGQKECQGDVLLICNAGGEYEVESDCAGDGWFCTDVKKECVPCISGRRYCVERDPDDLFDQRITCVDFDFPATEPVACRLGCVTLEDGSGDCATCEVAGDVFCPQDGTDLLRCPSDRIQTPSLELICPYGCDPDAEVPGCLPAP